MRSSAPETAGFTLLEMLVALALLGLLTAFLTSGLREASRTFRAWMTDTPADLGRIRVHDFLRLLLEGAYPAVIAGHASRLLTFDGRQGELTLTTVMPNDVLPAGYYRVGLRQEAQRLILTWTPERNQAAGSGPAAGGKQILDHVKTVTLRYFGAPRRDQPRAWSSTWADETHLPSLVAISVLFTDGDRSSWPPLIAPIYVEDDTGCIYDPSISDCLGR